MKKILNLKLVNILEFQNIKTFLLKDTLKIGQKTFLLLVKLEMQFRILMLLVTSMVNQLLEVFMKKKKTNQEKLRIENVIKRKGGKLYIKWKGHSNSFKSCIDKKDIV